MGRDRTRRGGFAELVGGDLSLALRVVQLAGSLVDLLQLCRAFFAAASSRPTTWRTFPTGEP